MTRRRGILLALAIVAFLGSLALIARKMRGGGVVAKTVSAVPATPRKVTPFEPAEVVLDGKLGQGWQDWGWGPHQTPESGSIRVTFESYGGLLLNHAPITAEYGALVFRYRAPKEYGEFLEVSLKHHGADQVVLPKVEIHLGHVAEVGDGWREALVPWSELNPKGIGFEQICIQARKRVGSVPVDIDKVVLAKAEAGKAIVRRGPPRRPKLTVHCDKPSSRISPFIYGIANDEWDTFATARRLGGNPVTRMNWDLTTWNVASDWYFENHKSANVSEVLATSKAHAAKTALVVPLIGWVAKDDTSAGFPVSKFGKQRRTDPYRPEAGDGYDTNGKPIRPGPPTQTSIAAPPDLIKKWISTIRDADQKSGTRRVDMYILDNEPNLWNTTHRDVHPDPLTYDELLDRTIRYGEAIRAADPDALIAGPAEWGWTGFFFSAKDLESGALLRLDRRAHGDEPLLAWYLRKLAEREQATRTRILDVVDVHFYPQAERIYGGGARTDPEGAALRLRSTRALWDPSYLDESWIADNVRLIPRLKAWIKDNYPGRAISIGEWSFGAEEHMSGGLAVAEALGRFAEQGIDYAFYWLGPAPGTPAFNGFRAYRNFDGKGGAFLGSSVPADGAADLSLFASKDDAGTRLVLVLLNLDPSSPVEAEIDIATCGSPLTRRAFTYEANTPGFVAADGTGAMNVAGSVREKLTQYSMKVVDITVEKPGPE